FQWADTLHEDSQGNLWVGGDGGVCKWQSGKAQCFPVPGLEKVRDKYGVSSIGSDSAGSLWIAAGPMGIFYRDSSHWKHYNSPHLGPDAESEAMLLDHDGSLWVGLLGGRSGLLRLAANREDSFAATDGLSDDNVTRIFEDREHNLWVATVSGLDCFRNL